MNAALQDPSPRRSQARFGTLYRRRFRPLVKGHPWILLGLLWVGLFLLGYVGIRKQFRATNDARSTLDPCYRAFQLFFMDDSMTVDGPVLFWELELARFVAPIVAAGTALLALGTLFREQLRRMRLRRWDDHVVICGLGEKGQLLAQSFARAGERVVAIEQDAENDHVRPMLEQGLIVLIGDATDPELLRRARCHRARYLFALCGSDGANAEIAVRAYEQLREGAHGRVLTCFVHIVEPQLCALLSERELAKKSADAFRLEFFNVFERGACALLNEHPPFSGGAGPPAAGRPHLLIVGLGAFGRHVVGYAARQWRLQRAAPDPKALVTIVDRNALQNTRLLLLEHPQIGEACELRAVDADVERPGLGRTDGAPAADTGEPHIAYVCLDDDSAGLAAGLALLKHPAAPPFPIIVRMSHEGGLATLLRGEDRSGRFDRLHAFPLLERTCRPDLVLGGIYETLARAVHAEYVRGQLDRGATRQTNPSLAPWEELPETLRESSRRQADHIGAKLDAIGCVIEPLNAWDTETFTLAPEEVERLARMEHERFVDERLEQGWHHAPGPKDVAERTSPVLIPWDQLPPEQKEIDREMVRRLPEFLAAIGLRMRRAHPA